ncbi:MAG: Ca2+/Na+ antiporter, partial [Colwellia sp.]
MNHFDNEKFHQPNVISLFALVGMSITALMGFIGLLNKNFALAISLFFASFIYFIGYYAYKKFNNLRLSSAIVLYS